MKLEPNAPIPIVSKDDIILDYVCMKIEQKDKDTKAKAKDIVEFIRLITGLLMNNCFYGTDAQWNEFIKNFKPD
jgi:hypothetical protein